MITKQKIIELYSRCATELPEDIARELRKSKDSLIKTILENIAIAKNEKRPICQDTGTPIFYVKKPSTVKESEIRKIIESATSAATKSIPLRPNAVEPLTGKNIGNRPIIHFEEGKKLEIDLLMKGGGSENVSCIYSLPDSELKAERDIDGIKGCVLDAVFKAQGKGCPPYIIGVAVGGTIEEVAHLSKKQLLRKLDDKGKFEKVENELLKKINSLGIGPLGLGGQTTALAVKMAETHRHPATFFVGISFGCWALRRKRWTSQS